MSTIDKVHEAHGCPLVLARTVCLKVEVCHRFAGVRQSFSIHAMLVAVLLHSAISALFRHAREIAMFLGL